MQSQPEVPHQASSTTPGPGPWLKNPELTKGNGSPHISELLQPPATGPQTKFCHNVCLSGPSFFSNYLSQSSHFPLKILKGLNRILSGHAGSCRERREVGDTGGDRGKEEKEWDHTGPLGDERKELQGSFIFQAENRQKDDNECQLSRPAEKHLKKKKHQHLIKTTLAFAATERQRWGGVKWFWNEKNNREGLMRSPWTR